jgi:hypothetical protein
MDVLLLVQTALFVTVVCVPSLNVAVAAKLVAWLSGNVTLEGATVIETSGFPGGQSWVFPVATLLDPLITHCA